MQRIEIQRVGPLAVGQVVPVVVARGVDELVVDLDPRFPGVGVQSDDIPVLVLLARVVSVSVVVGVVKARVADSSRLRGGFENMAIAGIGGVIAYFIGEGVGANLA